MRPVDISFELVEFVGIAVELAVSVGIVVELVVSVGIAVELVVSVGIAVELVVPVVGISVAVNGLLLQPVGVSMLQLLNSSLGLEPPASVLA